ncbi:MAG: orotate phosphoribosyltransferase [Paracoccaceae bacterium]
MKKLENKIARTTAKFLLEINAVHFNALSPFTLTSGLKSPVYIDCRKLISYPKARRILINFCRDIVVNKIGLEKVESLVGGETAGIPFASFLASQLELPMHYVRKKPKGFGVNNYIEGNNIEGKRVILVEDLTTDGGSKIKFCNSIRKAGAIVEETIVLFYYNIFHDVPEKLKKSGINLNYLACWWDILDYCKEDNSIIDNETISQIEQFLISPKEWSKNHTNKI